MEWKALLAGLTSIGFVGGGWYYVSSANGSLSLPYLGAATVTLVVGLALGQAVGAYEERRYLGGLVPFPVILLIGIADLWAGDTAVASVVTGAGFAGLLILAFLQLR